MALGGIINLADLDTWTLDSGLDDTGDICALDRYEDLFEGYVLDTAANGVLTAAGGYISQRGGYLDIASKTIATDAALWYRKAAINVGSEQIITNRFSNGFVNSGGLAWAVQQGAAGASINTIVPMMQLQLRDFVPDFQFAYKNAAGAFRIWNEVTGLWQAGTSYTGMDMTHGYEAKFIMTATSWRIVVTDLTTDTAIITTTPVLWADSFDDGNPYFLCAGDYVTSNTLCKLALSSTWDNYPLSSRVATMGQMDFNGIFNQFPITEDIDSGGSIVWEYNKDGAGWIQPGTGTPAEVEAALLDEYITTLDIRATLTSDALGDALSSFDINGGSVGCLPNYFVPTDSGDTIRQQIVDVLITRFATILVSNGYKTNMGLNVTHWRASTADVAQAKLPHLGWDDANEDELDVTVGQVDHLLSITCKVSAKTLDDVYDARADLIKLIGTDVFMSGLAGNTTPPVEQGDVAQGASKIWTQEYKFTIEYPTDRFDEYNQ